MNRGPSISGEPARAAPGVSDAVEAASGLWSEARLRAAREVVEGLLGASVELVATEPPRLCALREALSTTHAPVVTLALSEARTAASSPSWLTVEAAGASLWVDRMLGGDGLAAPVAFDQPLDAMSQGVLGYLVARACAAHGGGIALDPIGREPSREQLGQLGVRCAATLIAGEAACRAQLWTPCSSPHVADARLTAHGLAPTLELVLVADAGHVELRGGQLGALAAGDVVLLDAHALTHASATGWHGIVQLRAPQGGTGRVRCRLAADALVIEDFEPSKEPIMPQARTIPTAPLAPAVAALADAPIALSLELGRFAITLQELSTLRPGDVLVSGLEAGKRVALRAGTEVLATGELVEIDGQLGVRIERLAESTGR